MTGAVCQRELRTLGRYWGTYWLRVLAATGTGTALGLALFTARAAQMSSAQAGSVVFAALHGFLVVLLALVSPLLPADTLARERRDGTLGLLFLTPLRPVAVVAGKCAAQVTRGLMLWMSALPLLAVPVLLGGVTPGNFLWAAGLQAGVLMCGLGAGLFATSRARAWGTAMSRAVIGLAVVAVLGAVLVGAVVTARLVELAPAGTTLPVGAERLGYPPGVLFALPMAGAGGGRFFPAAVPTWVVAAGRSGAVAFIGFSLLWFLASIVWLGHVVGRELSRTESAPRPVEPGPDAGPWRRPWRRRGPSVHNPILWLQRASPGAWSAGWVWLVVVLVFWVGLAFSIHRWEPGLRYLGWWAPPLLLLALSLAACGSYRREIEEGTLELLLVTTLPPSRLVTGRLRWLLGAFLPALAVNWALVAWTNEDPEDWALWFPLAGLTVSSIVALPLIGLRCALRRVHPLNGWLVTGLWGVAFPTGVGLVVMFTAAFSEWIPRGDWAEFWCFSAAAGVFQVGAALWWAGLCSRELADRSFLRRPFSR